MRTYLECFEEFEHLGRTTEELLAWEEGWKARSEQVENLKSMLKLLEWRMSIKNDLTAYEFCGKCGNRKEKGHKDDCQLKGLLSL